MPNKILTILIAFLIIFLNGKTVLAVSNPLDTANNKFGIHINSIHDLEDAAKLVNSNGGDYGYVTVVIREDERNFSAWQEFFNKARKLHLIPIVRIASKMNSGGWEKLNKDEIPGWASFLNSLNWVTENRYVIVGNEPNHATEWGGQLNPEEYTEYLKVFSEKLKAESDDFFILPAGFDASAPTNDTHMSESLFIERMLKHNPQIFNYVDGWTSHSYPNPEFSGSETARGRGSLHTYEWEIDLLKSLGVTKDLPIFISETGWAHDEGNNKSNYLDETEITRRMVYAFKNNFSHKNIVAVTPFILTYHGEPFGKFSWKKPEGNFYSFYYKIAEIAKIRGEPKRQVKGEVYSVIFPPLLKKEESNFGVLYLKNTGQTIWERDQNIKIEMEGREITINLLSFLGNVNPGDKTLALYEIN